MPSQPCAFAAHRASKVADLVSSGRDKIGTTPLKLACAVVAFASVGTTFVMQAELLGIGLILLVPLRVPAPANAGVHTLGTGRGS